MILRAVLHSASQSRHDVAHAMPRLILGVALLTAAILAGVLVHPLLFALALVALVILAAGHEGRGTAL